MKEIYLGSVYLLCSIPSSAAYKYGQKLISGQSSASAFLFMAAINTCYTSYIFKKKKKKLCKDFIRKRERETQAEVKFHSPGMIF